MASLTQVALFDQIAVGQQNRRGRLVGIDRDRPDRQNIGPVRIKRDAPEPFGLALGAVLA
jgi:hypothetical protein